MLLATGTFRSLLIPSLAIFGSLLLLLCLLTGCNTIRGFPNPPNTADVESPNPGWELGPKAIKSYNAETDPARQKVLRNEIVDARLAALDNAFGDYERAIFQEDVKSGIATDWLVLGLTAGTT